ncbi:DUF3772 domain-containing protein [Alsobacter sp. KACC 23698]|uniref:DUF3772 domain-containing protein n=1 Tax=Alsobacter sp. KACC 23698 TaxID=3149229 RepID=A0AAU7JEQ2_9HYPH
MLLSLRAVRLLAIMAALALAGLASSARDGRAQWLFAQEDPAPAVQADPAPPQQAPPTATAQRAKLDGIRLQLDQLEAGVSRRETDEALQAVRPALEPLANAARAVVADLTPRADAIRSRLKELGPKPDDKAAPESADVSRERDDRMAALADVDETIRLARALLVQSDQIDKEVVDRRRDLFAKRLFQGSESIVSPGLWSDVFRTAPHDFRAISIVAGDAMERARQRLSPAGAAAFAGALALALVLILPVRRFSLAFVKRDRLAGQPNRFQKALAAATITLVSAVAPVLAAYLLFQIVRSLQLLPDRLEPVFASLVGGVAFISFVQGLADGLLAPGRMNWRLYNISDDRATWLTRLATIVAVLLVASRVLETVYASIAAGLKLTVATKGLFAIAVAGVIARTLQLIRSVDSCDEAAFGPHVSTEPDLTGPFRIAGWLLVSVVAVAVLLGYVSFAWFLAEQIAWVGIVAAVVMLSMTLLDEFVLGAFSDRGRTSRLMQATVGLSRGSLEQIGILASGLGRVALIGLAALLLLAPWGVESGDVFSSVRALFFGVTVGGVTLSLSTVLLAVVFFAIGIFATRAVQRWLRTKYLPHTTLDAGLRNSITMGIGYLGVVLTSAVSVSYLGLSLDKLTIVAGALSVGIGFGLQSIVNNFVSGLIILAERSIRVGDWIVVSGEQGHVRKINVRATQIETFDRGTLIVPNSNLVSGVVKNWVHSDRIGRVLISVPAPRHADADQIAAMLRSVAGEHEEVLEDPPPRVLFKTIKGDELSFDLICFVGDVDLVSRVSSDLTFAVFRRLREFGIGTPPGPPKFEIEGISDLRAEVEALRLTFGQPRPRRTQETGPNGAGRAQSEAGKDEDPQA